jgi:hypothetical protein
MERLRTCQMAMPPSRPLLVAVLPVSGRARVIQRSHERRAPATAGGACTRRPWGTVWPCGRHALRGPRFSRSSTRRRARGFRQKFEAPACRMFPPSFWTRKRLINSFLIARRSTMQSSPGGRGHPAERFSGEVRKGSTPALKRPAGPRIILSPVSWRSRSSSGHD